MTTRVVACLLGLLAITALPGPAHARLTPSGWLGVTLDGPANRTGERTWDKMQRAGVERVRTAFFWAQMQPEPGPRLDFSETDAIVLAAARHGMPLLPVLQHPPAWAAVTPGLFGSPPADPAAFAAFCRALVERYGPGGTFWRGRPPALRAPIRTWQVFNEPSLSYYWSVQPFAPSFVPQLRAATEAIHAADPGATVVLSGLPYRAWDALATIYAAGGRGSFDAVAAHPYTARPADVIRFIEMMRDVMAANGDAALPIWVTELSFPAAAALQQPPGWMPASWPHTGDVEQARLLRRTLRRLVAARERLRIASVLWYTWLSHEDPASGEPFDYAGLRRNRGGREVATPALRAYRRWARALAR